MSTTNKTVSLLAIALIAMSLSNCTSTGDSDKVDKASEEVDEAKLELKRANDKYEEEVASYRSSMEDELTNNEAEIERLKEKNLDNKGKANPARNAKIEVFESRNTELRMRIRAFQSKNKQEWEAFKKEFSADMKAWQQEIADFIAD